MTKMTLTIKQAAERIERSEQTILSWEKEGLLIAQRDDRGWRQFTEDDIERLEKIKRDKRERMVPRKKEQEVKK